MVYKYPQNEEEARKIIADFQIIGKSKNAFGSLIASFPIQDEEFDGSLYDGKMIELYKNEVGDTTLVIRGLYFEIGTYTANSNLYEDSIVFNDINRLRTILKTILPFE